MIKFLENFDNSKVKKYRVELHLHLGGCVRLSTIHDLAQQKNIKITKNNTLEEFQHEIPIKIDDAKNLAYFISKTQCYLPVLM